MRKSQLQSKKEWSEYYKFVEKISQPDHCLLCGRKMDSPCNSHIVPKFILKRIADDGMICYGQSLHGNEKNHGLYFQTTTGINNAFTFRLICRECDKQCFCHYEKPESILNFDNLSIEEQKIILIEMSIKTHLSHLYMKAKMHSINLTSYPEEMELCHLLGRETANELDIKEHFYYIKSLKAFEKKTSFPFFILYDHLLNYEAKITTQTIFAYTHDLEGNQIFDPTNFEQINLAHYFYLMIIPFQGKTRVLFYIEKKNQAQVQPIINGFSKLTEEEKLHFLFISLVIFDEQFYINPSLEKNMLKDKQIVRLYTRTDTFDGKYKDEIKNFRKYKNYLKIGEQKTNINNSPNELSKS